jgi:hypothetical protein
MGYLILLLIVLIPSFLYFHNKNYCSTKKSYLHDWEKWSKSPYIYQKRECKDCGKIEQREI